MSRVNDLLHLLTAVVIRYHDAQITRADDKITPNSNSAPLLTPQVKAFCDELFANKNAITPTQAQDEEGDFQLLKRERTDFQASLKELIIRSTQQYDYRRHLLYYFLNEIVFLKTTLNRKNPFTPEELAQYKDIMMQLITNFQQLLSTDKTQQYKVKYSSWDGGVDISLSGLSSYMGLCLSGTLLEKVLSYFHLSRTSTEDEVRTFVESLCSEHVNAVNVLLVPELIQRNLALEQQILLLQQRSPQFKPFFLTGYSGSYFLFQSRSGAINPTPASLPKGECDSSLASIGSHF